MKKIIIIAPHYPPSNLAAVHRTRLFAQHLPAFGWEPIILTVHEKFYEEKLDWNLHAILPAKQRVEKVKAFKVSKPRFIGDIGLRAFLQLYTKAKAIIKAEKIDFVYIPIPSFYCSLIGRLLNRSTGVKYGIDYIDPWVHTFPGSEKLFSRHRLSTQLAKWLEPVAVKNASLITGVAEKYYTDVIKRNPHLKEKCLSGAMPYGGEKDDFKKVKALELEPYLFSRDRTKTRLVYAGAMLPKAYSVLESIFKAISFSNSLFVDIEIHFIGTGKACNNQNAEYSIKPLAEKYNLWQANIFEHPSRISYLDVLTHLNAADGVFVLGSTESHYTPSKIFQAIIAEKPIIAVLHQQSTAVKVLQETNAGVVLEFDGEKELNIIEQTFTDIFNQYISFIKEYHPSKINAEKFENYSAASVTKELVRLLEAAVK